jgi:hypothetical protein
MKIVKGGNIQWIVRYIGGKGGEGIDAFYLLDTKTICTIDERYNEYNGERTDILVINFMNTCTYEIGCQSVDMLKNQLNLNLQ